MKNIPDFVSFFVSIVRHSFQQLTDILFTKRIKSEKNMKQTEGLPKLLIQQKNSRGSPCYPYEQYEQTQEPFIGIFQEKVDFERLQTKLRK
jgi:hypothetical protein